jgi:phosphosulfolactate synthase
MEDVMKSIWDGLIQPLLRGRLPKPRKNGLTMVLDKGLGLNATQDLLQTAAQHIDELKLTFGTSCCYDKRILEKKIEMVRAADIRLMPGGTLTEIAIFEGVYPEFLKKAKKLGFSAMEISDGTIDMLAPQRADYIKRAADEGFYVTTEVGTKELLNPKATELLNEQLHSDLRFGAAKVVIEAKEAGVSSTIYDEQGIVKESELAKLIQGLDSVDCLIWEAPLRDQQDYLIARFGANVNIGNCPPEGVLSLETLRNGLGETPFRVQYRQSIGK